MGKRTELPPTELKVGDRTNPVFANPAVARCAEAWKRVYDEEIRHGTHHVVAEFEAHKVFKYNLPPLTSHRNITDYIACVAYGIAIGAMLQHDGTKLLYAAQVALVALRSQAKKPVEGRAAGEGTGA
jgi:hypothetical protein